MPRSCGERIRSVGPCGAENSSMTTTPGSWSHQYELVKHARSVLGGNRLASEQGTEALPGLNYLLQGVTSKQRRAGNC